MQKVELNSVAKTELRYVVITPPQKTNPGEVTREATDAPVNENRAQAPSAHAAA